jgi:hypothetical protein
VGLADTLARLNPISALNREVESQVVNKTTAGVRAALAEVDKTMPVLGDLLTGEEIIVEIRVRLKPKQ